MSVENKETTMYIPLTQGKSALVYDEHSHLVSGHKWCYGNGGYAIRRVNVSTVRGAQIRATIFMHRYIWEAINSPIPEEMEIDHINGDKLDNRLENLRLVDKRQQAINRIARREGKTSSKYPGVTWDRCNNKWKAQIQVNGRVIHIGWFTSEEEAAMAYRSVANSISE